MFLNLNVQDILTLLPLLRERYDSGELSDDDVIRFGRFLNRKYKTVDLSPIVTRNPYTKQIARKGLTIAQAEDFFKQFSVFSNRFLVIQCERMVNTINEESEREARVILASEIGVAFDESGDVEGQKFSHKLAHINWLRETAEPLDLKPPRIPYPLGHWNLGTSSTHRFLKELQDMYGSIDPNIAAGASFGIETWAGYGIGKGKEAEANNFWDELIEGFLRFNEVRNREGLPVLNLGFFESHFRDESRHVESVDREFMKLFFAPGFDEEAFLQGAMYALLAIWLFWDGLERTWQELASV